VLQRPQQYTDRSIVCAHKQIGWNKDLFDLPGQSMRCIYEPVSEIRTSVSLCEASLPENLVYF